MRIRSTVLIPATGEGLDPALESETDVIALTLNDARRPVGALRTAAVAALPRIKAAGKLAVAVVNHPRTGLLRDDLDALVTPDLAAVFLPHATEPQDVRDLAVLLREFEYTRGIEPGTVAAFPIIDSAVGLLRAAEIAAAAPRVGGIVFDAAGYSEDIHARHEEHGPRFAYARGMVIAAARAHEGLPLTTVSGLDLLSQAHYGFAGAILPDGRAAGIANNVFTPIPTTVERLRAEAEAYDAARAEGAQVARFGTGVVDARRARSARQRVD
jgi:citrate lyase subunit beta/citryl-CoA lyase